MGTIKKTKTGWYLEEQNDGKLFGVEISDELAKLLYDKLLRNAYEENLKSTVDIAYGAGTMARLDSSLKEEMIDMYENVYYDKSIDIADEVVNDNDIKQSITAVAERDEYGDNIAPPGSAIDELEFDER